MESKVTKNTCNPRSLSRILSVNSVYIKQILQQQILAAITLSDMRCATTNLPESTPMTLEAIPVHLLSEDAGVLYQSAIALKLSPLWQLPALNIANQLTDSFATTCQDTANSISLDFSVEVVFPGWIQFQLSDSGLATWLQYLIQIPPSGILEKKGRRITLENAEISHPKQPIKGLNNAKNLFLIQYAHARCCSLLRLAHRQGAIALSDPECKRATWQIVEPNPIPWLYDSHKIESTQTRLRLEHPTERRLIAQILDVQDRSCHLDPGGAIKLAIALSHVFESFYSRCRIWGEVMIETPQLAQARLGLVAITQQLLRSLLQDQLGITPPLEL